MDRDAPVVILHPRFTPADCASAQRPQPAGSGSVVRPSAAPPPPPPAAGRPVTPAAAASPVLPFGAADLSVARSGKKQFAPTATAAAATFGLGASTQGLRQPGKRLCGPLVGAAAAAKPPSAIRTMAMPLASLMAAYHNVRPPSQRIHAAPPAAREALATGVRVWPVGGTDTILQLQEGGDGAAAAAGSRRRMHPAVASRQYTPDLLASAREEEAAASQRELRSRLHLSQRYRHTDAYATRAAGEEETKAGRRLHPAHNASAADVISSQYAPPDPKPALRPKESRLKYQRALAEAHRDRRTLAEISTYHRVRAQGSILALTEPLYDRRDTPRDLSRRSPP